MTLLFTNPLAAKSAKVITNSVLVNCNTLNYYLGILSTPILYVTLHLLSKMLRFIFRNPATIYEIEPSLATNLATNLAGPSEVRESRIMNEFGLAYYIRVSDMNNSDTEEYESDKRSDGEGIGDEEVTIWTDDIAKHFEPGDSIWMMTLDDQASDGMFWTPGEPDNTYSFTMYK